MAFLHSRKQDSDSSPKGPSIDLLLGSGGETGSPGNSDSPSSPGHQTYSSSPPPLEDTPRPLITPYLVFCVVSGALTAFQFGYNSGVVNQPLDLLAKCPQGYESTNEWFPICISMTDWAKGFFVSVFLLGAFTGGLIAGKPAAKYGRKYILQLNTITFITGGLCISLGNRYWLLCVGRYICGVGAGVGSVVLPLYISELSPSKVRGTMGSFNQLFIVTGVLTSVFVGMGLATATTWRYMFAITIVPSLLQNILLPLTVKSPKWLIEKERDCEAEAVLIRLRGHPDVHEELDQMIAALMVRNQGSSALGPSRNCISIRQLFFVPELRRSLLAAFGLQLTQQFSGINTAIYYSTNIFSKSFSQTDSVKLTAIVISVNLVMTLVSLSLIERLGRRTLLLAAESIMATGALLAFALGTFGAHPLTVVAALMLFLSGFGLGIGSIPWLILPELVPQYAVTSAATICSVLNWGSNAFLAFLMPTLISVLEYKMFLVFFSLLVGFAIFTYFIVPETKGLTAEQVIAQTSFRSSYRMAEERPSSPRIP